MLEGWEEGDDVVAGLCACPLPDCSSLVISYRLAGSIQPGRPVDWEFTCPRCGIEFTVGQVDLIFEAVPKQWLFANICMA